MENQSIMRLQLQCNFLAEPLAVDCGEVVFSFHKGVYSFDEYTLALASSKENLDKGIYDIYSGVHQETRVRLNLQGKAGERVYWRICTNNAISETSFFEWAEDLSVAKWIGANEPTDKLLCFKKNFAAKDGLLSARLHICGLGFYDFRLNGAEVDGHFYKPDFSDYIKRKDDALREKLDETYYAFYNSYDITPFVNAGENVLTTEVAPGYFNNTDQTFISYWHFGQARLKFLVVLRYADGTEYIVSDESCLCAITDSASTLYNGDRLDFRDKEYNFTSAKVLEEEIALRPALMRGDCIGEIFEAKLIAKQGNKWIYDFGQNHTGGLSCALTGEEGTVVTARFAEVMDKDGSLNFRTASFTQSAQYVLSGKKDTIKPLYNWHCYRYVEIEADKSIAIENLQSYFLHADIQKDGEFTCSEPLFNDIYKKYLYTQLCNMHAGVPTDCPHREKKPYTGDGHLTARAVLYNFKAEGFYFKWLTDIIESQEIDGYVPHTSPRMGCGGGFYWGQAIVELTKTLYSLTGDKSYLEKSYRSIEKWVEFFNKSHNGDYLPKNNGREWCLSDWLAPNVVVFDTRYFNAVTFYLSVKALNDFHKTLYGEHLERLTTLAEHIKKAVNQAYFDKEKLCYAKGVQGETVFALWAGIPEEKDVPALRQAVRNHYENETKGHFDTGIVLTPILLEYCTENGMKDLALKLMRQTDYPSFAYLLEGETTISEHWSKKWIAYKFSEDSEEVIDDDGDLSHCHPMFGSVVSWLFEYVAGLDIRGVYNNEIRISPRFIQEIPEARAQKSLDKGDVFVEYNATDGFVLRAKIPCGLTGKIRIDGLYGDFEVSNGTETTLVQAQDTLSLDIPCGEWIVRKIKHRR